MSRSLSLIAVALLLSGASVWAHGTPPPLEFWGNYPRAVARCQASIGRAVDICVARAWAARRRCLDAEVDGGSCDQSATDAVVQAARTRARQVVTAGCTESQLSLLLFGGLAEAQNDILHACDDAQTALISAAYGPLLVGGTATPSPSASACIHATAAVAGRMARLAFGVRRRVLNRIAATPLLLTVKQGLIDGSAERIARLQQRAADVISRTCPTADFTALYGRLAQDLTAVIAPRADCMTALSYAQAVILCPAPVCGNGVQETGEACDDGNADDNDACRNDCTLPPS